MNDIRRIDLTVPTGWNQCSVEQLEQISQILLLEHALVDRYHPYDPLKFKAKCFFSLSGIEVINHSTPGPSSSQGGESAPEHTYLCRRVGDKKSEPFPIQVWQVQSFVEQCLGWLDDFTQLQIFPYEQYPPHSSLLTPLSSLLTPRLTGPDPLLDGYSWHRYRLTQDYLQLYTMLVNDGGEADEIQDARLHFLMAIFDVDKPLRCLRRMPDYQFELVLIWWQSQMAWLMSKFKKCFKKGDVSDRGSLPIELYTRSTATLQKYLGLREADIDAQPCTVILQHLEDMAREAEEMERIRRKSK